MKIALCLSGLSRLWEVPHQQSFKPFFLDRHDCDVFIHTWSSRGWYSGKQYLPDTQEGFARTTEKDTGFKPDSELLNLDDMLKAYKPVSFRVEDFARYETFFDEKAQKTPNGYTRPKNTIIQAWNAMRVLELVKDYKRYANVEYDLVVRARPDILLENDPGTPDPHYLWTLPSRNKKNQGTGDSIQISNWPNALKFAAYYHSIEYLYHQCGQISCPHHYATKWIELNQIPWQELRIGAQVKHSVSGVPYAESD